MRYIFGEEDERVLLCQILVPLVPKIYEETDRRCYGSKRRGEEEEEEDEEIKGGGRRKKRIWKMSSRNRGIETGGEGEGGEEEKKEGGG